MSLKKYKDKRNFNNTPEPTAETNGIEDFAAGNKGIVNNRASTINDRSSMVNDSASIVDSRISKPGGAKHPANTSEIPVGTADANEVMADGHTGIAVGYRGKAGSRGEATNGQTSVSGGQAGTADIPVFVVQKHYASHLHFDFRLELDGVLKSWAIPKGPSINPKDKKLAVMVEDHPLEYKDFEGIIPEGNYGAGKVYQWDKGTYHALGATSRKESEELLRDGLQKGHLTFILNGTVLKGEFALIRLKKASPKDWLLIKKNDEFADEKDISKLESADEAADKDQGEKTFKNP